MAIALQNIHVRSLRRIRLKFTNTLHASAFDASWFSILCLDSSTCDPGIAAVYLIPNVGTELELAVSIDMAPGAAYELTSLAGITATDLSVTTLDVSNFHVPSPRRAPSPSVSANDVRAILFGEDLLFDKGDHVVTPDGDLASIGGEENAMGAVVRRAIANGLPYNADYGPKLRRYVDAPSPGLRSAQGDVERDARKDDRVTQITTSIAPDANNGEVTIQANVTLLGGSKRSFSQSAGR